jgi:hypothetical protein
VGLKVELGKKGITKTMLAEILDVSRQTIARMGDDIEPRVQKVLDEYVEVIQPLEVPMSRKVKGWDEYSVDEIRVICKRRGGIEGNTHSILETDYEIAHSLGLRVFEFNKMVDVLRQIGLKRGYEQVKEMKKAGNWPPPCPADGTA